MTLTEFQELRAGLELLRRAEQELDRVRDEILRDYLERHRFDPMAQAFCESRSIRDTIKRQILEGYEVKR